MVSFISLLNPRIAKYAVNQYIARRKPACGVLNTATMKPSERTSRLVIGLMRLSLGNSPASAGEGELRLALISYLRNFHDTLRVHLIAWVDKVQ